jgi:hypothetical protein
LSNPTNDPTKRPFPLKQWPALMPTISVVVQPEPVPVQVPESPKVLATRKSRKRKSSQSDTPEKPQVISDKLPAPVSLDTGIHRAVIIQRNQIYGEYEKRLTKRLQGVKERVQTLRNESQVFVDHWGKCVVSLREGNSAR